MKGRVMRGVELATDEPVVEEVAGLATGGELAVLLVAGLDAEAADVDESSHRVREDDASGDELEVVVVDEGPDGEVGALSVGASSEHSKDHAVAVES